jgi:hypothetical protein
VTDRIPEEKPSLEEVLAHHGVKGMHWGVRKDRDSGSSSGTGSNISKTDAHERAKKAYMGVGEIKRSPSEAMAALKANKQKFISKISDVKQTKKEESISKLKVKTSDLDVKISELKKTNEDLAGNKSVSAHLTKSANRQAITDFSKQRNALQKTIDAKERGKLTPTQKKMLIGAAVVGGLVAYNVYSKKVMAAHAGLPIDPAKFNAWTAQTKIKTWGFSGHIQPSSFEREAFTIPAGETFHRLSSTAEEGLKRGAYVTGSTDDFNRYVTGFRNEVRGTELHHITFKADKPIKVPDLTTTLETLRESMEERGMPASPRNVRSQYEKMSGGKWAQDYILGKDSKTELGLTAHFMDKLLSKGYGAFVDEMDAGVIGDKPLVFLDHESVTSHAVKRMSDADIKHAESNLKELTRRKT